MLNSRKKILHKCIGVVSLSVLFFSLYAEPPSEEVLAAAASGFPGMLSSIGKPEVRAQFNFSADEDIATCTLGAPFFLRTITPAALETYTAGTEIATLFSSAGTWLFPVIYQNEIRLCLSVNQSKSGVWKASSIGIAPLARQMNKLLAEWPREKGYDPILVQIFQTREYFFFVPQAKRNNLTRVFPRKKVNGDQGTLGVQTRQSLINQIDYADLDDATAIVKELLPDVRNAVGLRKK